MKGGPGKLRVYAHIDEIAFMLYWCSGVRRKEIVERFELADERTVYRLVKHFGLPFRQPNKGRKRA